MAYPMGRAIRASATVAIGAPVLAGGRVVSDLRPGVDHEPSAAAETLSLGCAERTSAGPRPSLSIGCLPSR